MNETLEDLVVKECRQPYINQLSKGYQLFALFVAGSSTVILIFCYLLWHKYKHLPRIAVRSMSVTNTLFLYCVIGIPLIPLTEALSNRKIILNSCAYQQFFFPFESFIVLIVLTLKLFQYYAKYKLYEKVVEQNILAEDSTKEECDLRKGEPNRYVRRSSPSYIKKLVIISLMFSAILSLGLVFLFCPEFNEKNFCPVDGNLVLYSSVFVAVAVFILTFLAFIFYATVSYPDPFGIIRECLVMAILFLVLTIQYPVHLYYTFDIESGVEHKITPYMVSFLLGGFQLGYGVPFQVYLALKEKSPDLSLQQIIDNPVTLALFMLHLEQEFSAENMKFYLAARHFRALPASGAHLIEKANAISEDYVADNAVFQINVGHHQRLKVLDDIEKKNIGPDLFLELEDEVFQIMEFDSYPRFLQSGLYGLYIGLTPTRKDTDAAITSIQEALSSNAKHSSTLEDSSK